MGSAADIEGRPGITPLERAAFELEERIAIMEALIDPVASYPCRSRSGADEGRAPSDLVFPSSPVAAQWQYSRSNGVALAPDWPSACERAWLELTERDRILRSWYGNAAPSRTDVEMPSLPSYDWEAYRFPGARRSPEVAGVFGFPRNSAAPLLRGFAASTTWPEALQRASRECLQGLAFLWGEEIPTAPPASAPNALFHLDCFLWPGNHRRLRMWLGGRDTAPPALVPQRPPRLRFVDIAPGASGSFVAKAICAAAVPLVFGAAPRWIAPPERRDAHPIP